MSPRPHSCPVAMTPTFATGTSEPVSGECAAVPVRPQKARALQLEARSGSQRGQIKLGLPVGGRGPMAWETIATSR